ncbi:MAG: glycoside hydrolase family 27 protein [Bryocella sp.]
MGAIVVLLAIVFVGATYAQNAEPIGDLTGYWAFRVPNGGTNYIQLKQTGNDVESIEVGFLRAHLYGTFHNGELHLKGMATHAGHSYPMSYDGRVSGQGIEAVEHKPTTINGGGDKEIHGTLERTTRSEIYPTPQPLPALRVMPDNGLVRVPPMGWNSWNLFHTSIDDKTVRSMADAMVNTGMIKKGYQYILIDGGWEGTRDAQGNLRGNVRFPDMKALADYVHSKGLKIGIYSSPGPRTCGGYVASLGHEQQDANTFAAWGFDYLKYDWCSASRIYAPSDKRAVFQKMAMALQATGRPIVYSLSPGGSDIWQWAPLAGANLWRTTTDITETWASIAESGFSQPAIAHYARPGYWNDPDNLEVGNGSLTGDEGRAQMSLWALLRAPLIAGNDLRTMSAETVDTMTNSQVIAIDQDPAALPLQTISDQPESKVYLRKLSGNAMALGIFNTADKPSQVAVKWSSMELSAAIRAKRVRALDVWKGVPVKLGGDSYTTMVPAHGAVLLRLTLQQ